MGEGIGLRHVCDYFMLLRNSSAEDRRVVAGRLKSFGLHHTAGALMWVLGKVLQLDPALMLCEPDGYIEASGCCATSCRAATSASIPNGKVWVCGESSVRKCRDG